MAVLVDTNILVYRFDRRFPEKQALAERILREGIEENSVRLPYQALVEFVAAVTRTAKRGEPVLSESEALYEVQEMLDQFTILYPNEDVFRLAAKGMEHHRLSWFDSHIWAYAEHFALEEIVTEDFQNGRVYGSVRIRNPFENPA